MENSSTTSIKSYPINRLQIQVFWQIRSIYFNLFSLAYLEGSGQLNFLFLILPQYFLEWFSNAVLWNLVVPRYMLRILTKGQLDYQRTTLTKRKACSVLSMYFFNAMVQVYAAMSNSFYSTIGVVWPLGLTGETSISSELSWAH